MQLIVVGMHRSGTSVLARMLNLMGAYFGTEGVSTGANRENPKGFWERRDVRNINDAVLHSVGCDWDRVSQFDVSSLPKAVVERFQVEASRVILDMDAHRPWLIKEPRLCLLLSLWKPLLEVPVCIHIVRHPIEVAASLRTRNGIPVEAGLALWQRYNHDAVSAMGDLPRIVVSHADLMREPVHAAARIQKSLALHGVELSRSPSPDEILAFVDSKLHRERHEAPELAGYADVPQCAMYERMLHSADVATKDELSLAPEAVASLRAYEAGLPVPEAKKSKSDREALDEANQELERLASRLSALQLELTLRTESFEQLKMDAESSRRSASFAIDECRRLGAQLDEISRARAADRDQLADVQGRFAQCDDARRVALEKLGVLRGEAAMLQEELKVAQQQRVALEERVSRTAGEALARQAELESVIAERFRETATITKLLAESEEARAQALSSAASLEARVTRLETDKRRLQAETVALGREKQSLTASLEEVSAQREELEVKISSISDFLGQEKMSAHARVNSASWRATAPLRRIRGILNGRSTSGCPVYGADVLRLHMSKMFDAAWYLAQYQDVAVTGADPVVHYLAYGAAEGRDPGPEFSTTAYLERNPDVKAAGMNPLVHLLTHGFEEGRVGSSSMHGDSHG
ncbi:sulfotransferase [Luteimonas sp. SDU101]|uniref:sulfotransferase family protein n=1 Tax=Luteimonas sp. SDU101 TaxID=3422593 RepID=UPI003EB9D760